VVSRQEQQVGACRLICGDALTVLPTLDTASVQLILVDPPYFRVKTAYNGEAVSWDRQWRSREAYLAWLRTLAKEWQRILTPNGSLYCFASPQMAAHVEVMLGELFTVLNTIRWMKVDGWHQKADKDELRGYLSPWEALLFCEQLNAESMALGASSYAAQCEQTHGLVFEPIRAYLDGERRRAGIGKAAVNTACGFAPIAGAMASRHYFSASQWRLPTAAHYAVMQRLFNDTGRKPAPPYQAYHAQDRYFARIHQVENSEYLRADYEYLRRPFTVNAQVPYTDVWSAFATVPAGEGKHPCEKPLPLLQHIILASSRPGDTVLDCCAGSFSTIDAARQCGRIGIGIEQDAKWWRKGCQRLAQECFFVIPDAHTSHIVHTQQEELFPLPHGHDHMPLSAHITLLADERGQDYAPSDAS
jgi:adenine-specific DNA-methyltransferase